MGLMEDLGRGPVGIDTAVFIYFIEEHPRYLSVIESLFVAIDAGVCEATTSALTLLETLVVPLKLGDAALADRYEQALTRGRGLRLIDLDRPVLRAAAHLRAATGLRTPDAIQLASALTTGCTAFITNDRKLPKLPRLRILQLNDYA